MYYLEFPKNSRMPWPCSASPLQILATSISLFPSHPTLHLTFCPPRPVCATQCSWMCDFLLKHGWFLRGFTPRESRPLLSQQLTMAKTKQQQPNLLLYIYWWNFMLRSLLHAGTCSGLGFHRSCARCISTVSWYVQGPYWVWKTLLPCSHVPPLPITPFLLPFLQWFPWPFEERGTMCMLHLRINSLQSFLWLG